MKECNSRWVGVLLCVATLWSDVHCCVCVCIPSCPAAMHTAAALHAHATHEWIFVTLYHQLSHEWLCMTLYGRAGWCINVLHRVIGFARCAEVLLVTLDDIDTGAHNWANLHASKIPQPLVSQLRAAACGLNGARDPEIVGLERRQELGLLICTVRRRTDEMLGVNHNSDGICKIPLKL